MKLLKILLEVYKEEYELNLQEGLTKTINIGKTISILKKKFPEWKFKIDDGAFFIQILGNKTEKEYQDLKQLSNNLGWFPSWFKIESDNGNPSGIFNEKTVTNSFNSDDVFYIELRFEAKFDEEVVENIPLILYHITPSQNIDKILKIGLSPKSRSKASYHPERVYLGKSIEGVEKLASQMSLRTGDKNFTILKIDTDLVPGGYLKLYTDPNYSKEAYYTLNNIPPQAIEKAKEINI
jgi:hypothetical protein